MSLTPKHPVDSPAQLPAPAETTDRPLTRKELIALERAAAPAQINDAPEGEAPAEPDHTPSGIDLPPAAPVGEGAPAPEAGQAPEPAPASSTRAPGKTSPSWMICAASLG